jgi:Domain of unknown function (DUF4389)
MSDDLRRTRLTVFFRLLLVIPHLIVLLLWGIAAYIVWIINWFATLFMGQSPDGLHNFLATWLRYSCQVTAYYHLLADPYPSFGGGAGYPVDLVIAPPQRQNRWTVFFRYLIAIPALILYYVLNSVFNIVALFAWFACLFTGKMPEGLENLGAFVLKYGMQTTGYLMLLTGNYPSLSMSTGAEAPSTTPTTPAV